MSGLARSAFRQLSGAMFFSAGGSFEKAFRKLSESFDKVKSFDNALIKL